MEIVTYKDFKCNCRYPARFEILHVTCIADINIEYVECSFCSKVYEILIDYIDMKIQYVRRVNIVEVRQQVISSITNHNT